MHMTGGDFDGDLNMLSFCPELIALAEGTEHAVAAASMEDVAEALGNLRFKRRMYADGADRKQSYCWFGMGLPLYFFIKRPLAGSRHGPRAKRAGDRRWRLPGVRVRLPEGEVFRIILCHPVFPLVLGDSVFPLTRKIPLSRVS